MNTSLAPHAGAADQRLRHIDALRGIAALLVLWLHLTQTYPRLSPQQPLAGAWLGDIAQALDFGRVGVVMFFLISGYVIPGSIRLDRPAPLATFAIRRIFRIYPAYWLSIPLCAMATWWIWGTAFGTREFLVNLSLLQDLFGIASASGAYWTLLVELCFYLLCIVLALMHSLRDGYRIVILAGGLALIHTMAMFVAWLGTPLKLGLASYPLHIAFMLCGTLFRLADDGVPMPRAARRMFALLVVYLLIVFPAGAIWAIGAYNNYVVASALGLLGFVLCTRLRRPTARVAVWLGSISYSIYLLHPFVFMALLWLLLRLPEDSPLRAQHMAVYLVVNAVLTVGLAALVYRWVEKPGIKLGHRLARAWARRSVSRMDTARAADG